MNELGILSKDDYKALFRVYNAQSFSNPAMFGIEQNLTTLTRILTDVNRQKFYTVAGALDDYVPVELGQGAYGKELMQYTVAQVGADFEQGVVQPGNGINKDANLDIVVDKITIRNNYWRMKYQATKEIVEMARANAVPFSYIEEQENARLKTWQLGIQKVMFTGYGNYSPGLLNQPGVTINTSLLPASLPTMSLEQLTNFAQTAILSYFDATNSTVFPNTLLLPTAWLGTLGVPVNPEFPIGTKRQFLENAFKEAGAPADFKILSTVYNNTAGTGGAGRAVLYNNSPDTLTMHIPKPYTPYPLFPTGALDMISDCEGQFTGVLAKREKEILYLDAVSV